MKYLASIIVLCSGLVLTGCGSTPALEDRTTLAECVTDAGWTMYGTETCGYCKAQKQLFGTAFEHISYVNCEEERQICDIAGVTGYPTWISNEGQRSAGLTSLEDLATLVGCEFDAGDM